MSEEIIKRRGRKPKPGGRKTREPRPKVSMRDLTHARRGQVAPAEGSQEDIIKKDLEALSKQPNELTELEQDRLLYINLLKRKRKIMLARENLIDYAEYTMPHPDDPDDADKSMYVSARHHKAMANALERVESGEITRLIITLPPRAGKSELASKKFPAWYLGRNPHHHIMLASYNDRIGKDFGRAVRANMLSETHLGVFPDSIMKPGEKSADRIALETGGVAQFTSRGGTITGRGGHILLIDDPIKDRKEADSPTIRDQLWDWYNQVIKTRLMTDGCAIIIIMTRWHEDDLVGRLTDPFNEYYSPHEAKSWHKIDLPALAEEDDPLGRKVGEPLWPERFGKKFYADIQRADPRGFMALYQGRPSPADGTFFKEEHLRVYQSMDALPSPNELTYYITSDHAVSLKQENDRSCFIPLAVDRKDNIWVMPDVFWDKTPTNQAVEIMLGMIKKYEPIFWWAERGHITKSIGPFLRQRMLEESVFCSIDEITPVGDKQQRAQSIQARSSMGKVYFPAFASWWPRARDELLKFPRGLHDDFVDALGLAGLGLARMRFVQLKSTPEHAERPKGGFTLGQIKAETAEREREDLMRQAAKGW